MHPHPDLDACLSRLSLEEKVSLLTGLDHWRTRPVQHLGLRSMLCSDGPVGVRGEVWDERRPSLNLPSATVLAATWDLELARRYGRVLAGEARRRGVDVLLAPTVNLHRSAYGGRNFEAFSEDPVLTGEVAASLVAGVQEGGVGAAVKHYVANDYETERFTASSEVSDRALREMYLRPFEAAVVDGGAWLVMSAYNGVNGVTASESRLLLDPLKSEWGFDGVVISDWSGVRSLAAAAGGQDLVMPGPNGPWGPELVAAVRDGRIAEAVVDEKVRRLLRLAARVGALADPAGTADAAAPDTATVADGVELAREVAADGTVLLTNDGILPLDPDRLRSVAVIGHNAARARTQGGGSATVLPDRVVSPLDGLREALPATRVTHALGAVVQDGVAGLPLAQLRHPETGEPGAAVTFRAADGTETYREHRLCTDLVWFGGDAPVLSTAEVDIAFTWVPARTGTVRLGFAAAGAGTLHVDGEELVSGERQVATPRLGASPLAPPSVSAPVAVVAGEPRAVLLRLRLTRDALGRAGLLAVRVGTEPDAAPAAQLIAEAAAVAADADVAVVVVGTNSDVESEGFDRSTLALPGTQDDLVRAVAATGTPTIVVVNSGAPVLLPWRRQVAAVVVPHFGGQELGAALAEVLLGRREPGGRLPTTWPDAEGAPVPAVTPEDGRLEYREGIHVGYRGWLRESAAPAFWFGHGLGYTTWDLSAVSLDAPRDGADGSVTVTVRNTGARPGKQVLQLYLARDDSAVDRPVRWLAGHQVVRAAAGEESTVRVRLPRRALAHWDDGWRVEPGRYQVLIGTSAVDLPVAAWCTVPLPDPA